MDRRTLYLDEAGATGNNVDDLVQPVFVMAAVFMQAEEASALVNELRQAIGTTAPELKASRILKIDRGQLAVSKLLSALRGRATTIAYDKGYSVYQRIYDYILDEIDNRFAQYLVENLHRALAFHMFADEQAGEGLAPRIREAVVDAFRRGSLEKMDALLSEPDSRRSTVSARLHRIMRRHPAEVRKAVSDFRAIPAAGDWLLETSFGSINWSCAYWSRRSPGLRVVADQSKPTLSQRGLIDKVIAGTGRRTALPDDPDFLLPPDVHSISLEDSRSHAGLQLADIVAGAAVNGLMGGAMDADARPLLLPRVSVLKPRPGYPSLPLPSKRRLVEILKPYE